MNLHENPSPPPKSDFTGVQFDGYDDKARVEKGSESLCLTPSILCKVEAQRIISKGHIAVKLNIAVARCVSVDWRWDHGKRSTL